jgi:hypothetical protein
LSPATCAENLIITSATPLPVPSNETTVSAPAATVVLVVEPIVISTTTGFAPTFAILTRSA